MKTYVPTKVSGENRKWYLVDAENQVLGKLAVLIANILRGKNKATFTPHLDLGDYVVVINAEKIRLSGNKLADKKYYSHSGYIGSLKETSAEKMLEKSPEKVMELAVKGMIPSNKLKKEVLKRLKLVIGSEHNFAAQKPEKVIVNS